MKQNVVIASVILILLMMAAAVGQQGMNEANQQIPSAQRSNRLSINDALPLLRDLRGRVERLEARAALDGARFMDSPNFDQDTANQNLTNAELEVDPNDNVIQLIRFDIIAPNPDDYLKLRDLEDEVAAIKKTVVNLELKVTSMSGRTSGSGGSYRGGSSRSNSNSRRRAAQAELLSEWRKRFREKNGEMLHMKRDIENPKQIIHGNWGNRVITLRTTADMSNVLSRVDNGQYLTWRGRRLRSDATSEEWVVSSISRYDL
ncbi:MAG: hypothetical protein O7G85_04320 [Planctomycetota bacterium]|nr:hypothetical protein [Planctomycetota bacterium]